jgi:hypothetical protein
MFAIVDSVIGRIGKSKNRFGLNMITEENST